MTRARKIANNDKANKEDSQKGKAMTTVRFAYVLNSERHYDLITTDKCREWSDFVCSYKIKSRQRITV